MTSVSVVIATRNRPASLARTLAALAGQERAPDEVLIVDASDDRSHRDRLREAHPTLPLAWIDAAPGVCAQRNAGIRRGRGSHILICDDDIVPPPDYLARLVRHVEGHPEDGAVTGALRDADASGGFRPPFPPPSGRYLLFAFVFQLTVWGDTADAPGPLRRWYRSRRNGWSLAGWPLVTEVRTPVVRVGTYGLGAALVRRDWLLASPYDEALGAHGVGDNYGVALGFPGERPVTVLTDLEVPHHREAGGRLEAAEAYYRRVLALDHFVRTSPRFPRSATAWLAWSLAGNLVHFAWQRRPDLARRTLRALGLVLTGRNPLPRQAGRRP